MITGNEPATGFSIPGDDKAGWRPESVYGLTIRQHFAAMCLQGLLSIYNSGDGLNPPIVPNEENINYMAALSVKASDALINELNKTEKQLNHLKNERL